MARHGHSVYELPLDVCLKNSVALSYFLDFMANVESQVYVFFLINVEGILFIMSTNSYKSLLSIICGFLL